LINERLFHNGKAVAQVPLLTLFGASNELPEEEELTALYDRFLVRFVVNYIAEDFRFLRMLESQAQTTRTSLTLSELTELQGRVREVVVPSHIYRSIADIRRELNKKNIQASDRRYRQSLSLLQARAYLEGQPEVLEKDLFFLEHVLWRDPGEHEQVRNTIRELLLGYEEEITELLYESRELRDSASRSWETSDERARALVEFHTKLRNILTKVDQVIEKAKRLGRPLDRVGSVRSEIEQIQKEMLEQF
jgi:MoxR-like ATPase